MRTVHLILNTTEYNEKCRIGNPCKFHRGYTVQIKDCNSCLEDVCNSHTKGFLCPNGHKCDQWENTYPGMIVKNLNVISVYI